MPPKPVTPNNVTLLVKEFFVDEETTIPKGWLIDSIRCSVEAKKSKFFMILVKEPVLPPRPHAVELDKTAKTEKVEESSIPSEADPKLKDAIN